MIPQTATAPAVHQTVERRILIPAAHIVTLGAGSYAALTVEGELVTGKTGERLTLSPSTMPVMACHAPFTATRAGLNHLPPFDVLELFAFVHPATFCTPTVTGLCRVLNLQAPQSADDGPEALLTAVREMMAALIGVEGRDRERMLALANAMGMNGRGWAWTPYVMAALGVQYEAQAEFNARSSFNILDTLPEWSEGAPPPPPAHLPLSAEESRAHLKTLLDRRGQSGRRAEMRSHQENYTTRITSAFAPVDATEAAPNIVLAEAGTGVGKTLGYLAPAQAWAEKNEGAVWISTYTRNLQRQIDQELKILYPDDAERARKAVVRKGRENYLCQLNFSELVSATVTARDARTVIAAGLMARWIMKTNDGDLTGNTFPGWLPGLIGADNTVRLADKRGECTYGACDHYHTCFVERAVRKAQHARIVIANHALVMIQTAMADDAESLPHRYVFDEGHHLFDAADNTFAAHFTGQETHELRRWIVGPEDDMSSTRRTRRGRGLKKRVEGLVSEESNHAYMVEDAVHAARALPGPGWAKRIPQGQAQGPVEIFLAAVRAQVYARTTTPKSPYALETDVHPIDAGVAAAVPAAMTALKKIQGPLASLSAALRKKLEDEYGDLDEDTRRRLEALSRSIDRRASTTLAAWIGMLENLRDAAIGEAIDWFEVTRIDGQDYDVGFFRHLHDPAKPFAQALKPHAHGVVVTSATLRVSSSNSENVWADADKRTGASYLSPLMPDRVEIPSPFAYGAQTRVLVVRDVPRNDDVLLAKAMTALFRASKGGALGLFTAISRLKAAHREMVKPLAEDGLALLAQHVDDIDIGTLVDMFREDEDSCLLGTDAVRDGVDVPGRSLRLIAFDRVPWPRPTILHRERKKANGGKAYDDNLARMKLRQAYGRLIRAADDKGVFVMLDGQFPSRLEDSFPADVKVERVSLTQALEIVRDFL